MKAFKLQWRVLGCSALILLLSVMVAGIASRASVAHADTSSFTRDISSTGVASFASAPSGTTDPVFPGISGVDDDQGAPAYAGAIVDRSDDQGPGQGAHANGSQQAKSNPE